MDGEVRVDTDVCVGDWEIAIVAVVLSMSRRTHLHHPIFGLVQCKFCHSHHFWYLESGMIVDDLLSLFDHGLQLHFISWHVGSAVI